MSFCRLQIFYHTTRYIYTQRNNISCFDHTYATKHTEQPPPGLIGTAARIAAINLGQGERNGVVARVTADNKKQ